MLTFTLNINIDFQLYVEVDFLKLTFSCAAGGRNRAGDTQRFVSPRVGRVHCAGGLFPTFFHAQLINLWILEGQLPHKIVNLIFESVIANNVLTILWGSSLSKTNGYILFVR